MRRAADFFIPGLGILLALAVAVAAFAQQEPAGMGTNAFGTGPAGGMTPDQWYYFVCGNDGAVVKWFVHICTYGLPTVVLGMIASNSKRLQSIPLVNTLINYVAGNWTTWIREAAQKAATAPQPVPPPVAQPKGTTP